MTVKACELFPDWRVSAEMTSFQNKTRARALATRAYYSTLRAVDKKQLNALWPQQTGGILNGRASPVILQMWYLKIKEARGIQMPRASLIYSLTR